MDESRQTRQLVRLIGAQICLHTCMAGMRMATPLLALREGYSAMAVGVLLALFSLAQVFLAIPAGRFADRHGLRRPAGLAVIVSMVGTGLATLFPVFGLLCLAAMATGAATGCTVIAVQRHVGRMVTDLTMLRRAFSWLGIGPAFSNFLGPFVAGLLIDHAGRVPGDTWGYQAAFLFLTLMPLLTWWLVRRTPGASEGSGVQQGRRGSAWGLLREPLMRRLMIVNLCVSACWDIHTFVVPLIGHERALSASAIGTLLGVFAIAAVLVRLVMPMFAARLAEHAVLAGAMVITALAFAVYPFMLVAWTMGICSVVLGMALGSVQPMVMSMLHQITPITRHGEALGLRLTLINASSLSLPLLFGAVGSVVGVSLVFWVMGAAVGAGSRLAWGLRAVEGTQAPH